jgi:hypothetical protein
VISTILKALGLLAVVILGVIVIGAVLVATYFTGIALSVIAGGFLLSVIVICAIREFFAGLRWRRR